MIRLLAFTFAATLAMLAFSLRMGGILNSDAHPTETAATTIATVANSVQPEPPHIFNPGATIIARDSAGQFHVTGQVNGQTSEFLVDTGADIVALTCDEAQRLGIFVFPGDFRPILRTASGTANGAPIHIDRLTIGGIELHHVDAVVIDGLSSNLLGQSALRQLGKLEQQGDRMVIDPG